MRATKVLPTSYQSYVTIRPGKSKRLIILLTLLGMLLFLGFGWLFGQIALLLRPDAAPLLHLLVFPSGGGWQLNLPISWIGGVLLALVLVPLLHEAVHGLVFWLFTRDRPRFAYKLLYAYAAAPEWYIPRGPYLLVGLAPLVVLSLAGVACLPFIPQLFIPFLLAFLIFNASGAVGDLAVVVWLLFQPATLLARDSGDALALYRPASAETS